MPFCYALLEQLSAVLIGSGIQGIGDAIWDIGFLAYMFRLAPGREAVVVGLHFMLFGIRGTIGPLSARTCPTRYRWRTVVRRGLLGFAGLATFIVYNGGKLSSRGASRQLGGYEAEEPTRQPGYIPAPRRLFARGQDFAARSLYGELPFAEERFERVVDFAFFLDDVVQEARQLMCL